MSTDFSSSASKYNVPPFWGKVGIDLHLLEVSQTDRVDQERRQVCRPEVLGGYGVLLNFKNDGFIFRMKGCLLRTCVAGKKLIMVTSYF